MIKFKTIGMDNNKEIKRKDGVLLTRTMLETMQGFLDGKVIQCRERPVFDEDIAWVDCSNPAWDWAMYEYRIKPIPQAYDYNTFLFALNEHKPYVKYKDANINNRICYSITTFDRMGITISDLNSFTYDEIRDLLVWSDNSPLGIIEN